MHPHSIMISILIFVETGLLIANARLFHTETPEQQDEGETMRSFILLIVVVTGILIAVFRIPSPAWVWWISGLALAVAGAILKPQQKDQRQSKRPDRR